MAFRRSSPTEKDIKEAMSGSSFSFHTTELLPRCLPTSRSFCGWGLGGRALFEKSALPRTPSLKNFDWWGGCAAGVPFAGKRKRAFFRNFFRVLSVLFNGALLGFLSSLKQEKPPEYPRGLFLCPENVRQAVSQRLYSPGRARYCGRGLPLGEKAEGGHCGISPASPLLRVPFYLSGGSDWPPPRL